MIDDIDEILNNAIITIDGEEIEPTKNSKEDDVDIDDLINEVGSESIEEDEEEGYEVTIPTGNEVSQQQPEIDLEEKHSLANKIVENSLDVIKKADKVFTNFSDDVMHGKDRSTSSKEMLIKALEIQNSANKNLIDLARTVDKENSGNTNILIGASISPKKTGVDPDNLKSHFKKK